MQGKKSPAKDARVFLPGTVTDLAMREFLEDPSIELVAHGAEVLRRLTEPKTEAEKADRDVRPIAWKGNVHADKRRVESQVRRTLENLEPWLREEILPYRYQPELRFKQIVYVPSLRGAPAPIVLTGGLDIVKRDDDDDFHGYDLKTTEDEQYVRKTLGQAIFYDLAFGHYIGDSSQPKSFAFVFPLLKKKIHPVTVTNDERMAMMQRIVRMAHGIWKGEWGPKVDDAGCNYCDVRHACDKFKLQLSQASGKNLVSFEAQAAQRRTSTA